VVIVPSDATVKRSLHVAELALLEAPAPALLGAELGALEEREEEAIATDEDDVMHMPSVSP
jgi:hypothetical protein